MTSTSAENAFAIPVQNDFSQVIQSTPFLILRSDKRNKKSPYIAYLPNAETPVAVFIDFSLDNIRKVAAWDAWITTPFQPIQDNPCFQKKTIGKKRPGIFATRKIMAGELIMKERPFFVTFDMPSVTLGGNAPLNIYTIAASRLPVNLRKSLLSFDNRHTNRAELDDIAGRLVSNVIPIFGLSSDDPPYNGAFPKMGSVGPSCSPNANFRFDYDKATGRLYAMRDIEKGEEIRGTLPPHILTKPRAEGQEIIRQRLHLNCDCPSCSLPASQSQVSDENRAFITQIMYQFYNNKRNGGPAVPVKQITKAIGIASAENLIREVCEIKYNGGLQLLKAVAVNENFAGDSIPRAVKWLRESLQGGINMQGADSSLAMEKKAELEMLEQGLVMALEARAQRNSFVGVFGLATLSEFYPGL